jgi:Plasmid pRiA4b ORF-3-like protein
MQVGGYQDTFVARVLHQDTLTVRERFLYEYDFTDGWQHDVRIEQIVPLVPGRHYPACIGGRRRVPPEDCGGPWAFLELRQRYSLLNIADRLYELARRRLAMGGAAFVDDHYEDVLQLLGWLEVDRFDRRAVNRRLAELAIAPVGSAA